MFGLEFNLKLMKSVFSCVLMFKHEVKLVFFNLQEKKLNKIYNKKITDLFY